VRAQRKLTAFGKPPLDSRVDNVERVVFGFLTQGFLGRLRWLFFGPHK
jgi:hypothetical protein